MEIKIWHFFGFLWKGELQMVNFQIIHGPEIISLQHVWCIILRAGLVSKGWKPSDDFPSQEKNPYWTANMMEGQPFIQVELRSAAWLMKGLRE